MGNGYEYEDWCERCGFKGAQGKRPQGPGGGHRHGRPGLAKAPEERLMTSDEYWMLVDETVDDVMLGIRRGETEADVDLGCQDHCGDISRRFSYKQALAVLQHCGDHQAEYGEHGHNRDPNVIWRKYVGYLAESAFLADVTDACRKRYATWTDVDYEGMAS